MNRRWLKRTLFALFVGASSAALAGAEQVKVNNTVYYVYRIDRKDQGKLQLVWLGDNGRPLNTFSGLIKQLEKQHKRVAFALNAGIFETGPKPLGLTIIDGKEVVPLNLMDDPALKKNPDATPGNFYLKPNGVFYMDDKLSAGVMESVEFSKSGLKPRLATQSGPLLLRGGKIHDKFQPNSTNKLIRNGVGVRAKDGQIIFATSDRLAAGPNKPTLMQFAQFFLGQGCQDALFLDGDISDMLIDPKPDTKITPNTFGAMFVITKDME